MKPTIPRTPFREGGLGKAALAARGRRKRPADAEPVDYPKKPRLKRREGARNKGRLSDYDTDDEP